MRAKNFIPLAIALTLSGCKIANNKRPIGGDSAGEKAVFGFIKAAQVAVSDPDIALALGGISGEAIVATKDSTFQGWIEPAAHCVRTSADGVNVVPSNHPLEFGELKIGDFDTQETTIPFYPSAGIYYIGARLGPGDYRIRTAGNIQGSYVFSQDFTVLPAGTNIRLTSGDDGTAQKIPSPDLPAATDTDFLVTLDRTKNLKIEYEAPEGTDYVRTFIYDGSNVASRPIVCYSPPFTPTTVPEGMLLAFRQTDDAYIYVDFVSISVKTDIPNIKESFIQSYKRHIHGMHEYTDADGNPFRLDFGKLRLQ